MRIRQMFTVSWNGGDPVNVVTNARDIANVQDVEEMGSAMRGFAIVHRALQRYGHQVPELDEWIDQLDEFEPVKSGGDPNETLPIRPVEYGSEPSPSPYPPEQILTRGPTTTEPLSPLNT
jgi:hypothetical protein